MARWVAGLMWLLVVATAGWWGWWALKARPVPAGAPPAVTPSGDLGRVLGAPAAAGAVPAAEPALAARIRLLGVMAPRERATGRAAAQGVALLAIDGKPPRAYRVGMPLDNELMLQAVGHRSATIATIEGDPRLRLELPPGAAQARAVSNAPPAGLGPAAPPAPAATPASSVHGVPPSPGADDDAGRRVPKPGEAAPTGGDPQQQIGGGSAR